MARGGMNSNLYSSSRHRGGSMLSSIPITRLLSWGGVALFLLATILFVSFVRNGSLFGGVPPQPVAQPPILIDVPPPPKPQTPLREVTVEERQPEAHVLRNNNEVGSRQQQEQHHQQQPPVDEGEAITISYAPHISRDDPAAPPPAAPPPAVEQSKSTAVIKVPAEGAEAAFPAIELPFERVPPSIVQGLLPKPHGVDELVDLIVSESRRQELESDIATGAIAYSWTLTQRQACDAELLLSGGFSPLDGFMTRDVYDRVVSDMRTGPRYGDVLWPMPITLDIPVDLAKAIQADLDNKAQPRIALRDEYHNLIAVLNVEDVYKPDRLLEAANVMRTTDPSHPSVGPMLSSPLEWVAGGRLEGIALPKHYDFTSIRLTPAQVRAMIVANGWPRTVAFQTRNPMHRAHIELTKLAAVDGQAGVLVHPSVGMTKPGDVEASVRVRCYQAMIASNRYYAKGGVVLSLLPLAMRMAGPREALWHAIIRKNHGATHFIVGRDHAGCKSAAGKDFYGAYDAQELVGSHEKELGITVLKYTEVEYVPRLNVYLPGHKIPPGEETLSISGTKFRAMMNKGESIPQWFSDPDVIRILRELMPPLYKRGFAIFFTGLSGGGKTTIAHGLIQRLSGLMPTRRITFLDGDVVRTHLSKGLGFSIADRNTNVARIGFVAGEAVKHGGIVLASAIAPFAEGRQAFKSSLEASGGGFFQVYVASSLAVCAARDVKGLYELAANGKTDLTGVSHPYELPDDSTDLVIDTERVSVDDAVAMIVSMLARAGYINIDEETPGNVVEDLTTNEQALLSVLADADAAVPTHVAELAHAFTGNKVDIAASSAGGLGPDGRGMCSNTWDVMEITKEGDEKVAMYGGLPMRNSIAYEMISSGIQRDETSGAIQTPPDHITLGLAHGPVGALLQFVLKQADPSNAVYAVHNERLLAAEKVAAIASKDEAAAAATITELLENEDLQAGELNSVDVLGDEDAAWMHVFDTSPYSGTPLSSSLPDSAKLYAAFDLWTHMRWYRQVNEEGALARAPRSRTTFVGPRLVVYATQMLRLDPCARVISLLPPDDSIDSLVNILAEDFTVQGRRLLGIGAPKSKHLLGAGAGNQADRIANEAVTHGENDETSLKTASVRRYIDNYIASVNQLAVRFPERVTVLQLTVDAIEFATKLDAKTPPSIPASVQSMIDTLSSSA